MTINLPHACAYVGSYIVSLAQHCPTTEEKSEHNLFVINSTHCNGKAVLYQRNDDADHTRGVVPKCLDGDIKIYLKCTPYRTLRTKNKDKITQRNFK